MYGANGGKDALETLGIPAALAGSFTLEDLDIYPENWDAVRLMSALGTQWRIGMGGPTGLDYSALPAVMDLLEIADRRQAFDGLRVMEAEVLALLSEKRD